YLAQTFDPLLEAAYRPGALDPSHLDQVVLEQLYRDGRFHIARQLIQERKQLAKQREAELLDREKFLRRTAKSPSKKERMKDDAEEERKENHFPLPVLDTDNLEDRFTEMHRVVSALRQRDVEPALR